MPQDKDSFDLFAGPPQVIGLTLEGRPVIRTPDGAMRSEFSATISHPKINGGKFTNIPTIFGGIPSTTTESIKRIIENKGKDPDTGRILPGFNSREEAERSARQRSPNISFNLFN